MNIERLLQRIRLGEDSTLELKQVRLRTGGKTIEPHADGLSDELAALGNAHTTWPRSSRPSSTPSPTVTTRATPSASGSSCSPTGWRSTPRARSPTP